MVTFLATKSISHWDINPVMFVVYGESFISLTALKEFSVVDTAHEGSAPILGRPRIY